MIHLSVPLLRVQPVGLIPAFLQIISLTAGYSYCIFMATVLNSLTPLSKAEICKILSDSKPDDCGGRPRRHGQNRFGKTNRLGTSDEIY